MMRFAHELLEKMGASLRFAMFATAFLATATAISGCGEDPSHDSLSVGAMATTHAALNAKSDIDHLGPMQPAAFTLPGDSVPNIGTFGDEIVLSFVRDEEIDHCYYVKGATIEEALAQPQAQKIELPGVVSGEVGINSCIFHDDRIYYQRGAEFSVGSDVLDSEGVLLALNPLVLPGFVGSPYMTIGVESGVPFLIYIAAGNTIEKRNLITGVDTPTEIPFLGCGIPHADAETGVWVNSRYDADAYGGLIQCRLVSAGNMEAIAFSLKYIPGIMQGPEGLTGEAKNPRLSGQVLVFEGRELAPGGNSLEASKIYYATVAAYCGDGTCDEDETNESCPQDCAPPDPACPDGTCNGDETFDTCPLDCDPPEPACPDGTCNGDETFDTCPQDCDPAEPACPDGECNGDEPHETCPEDCGYPPEDCADGTDNDGDDLEDCADPDCDTDPHCQPDPDPCAPVADRVTWAEGPDLCECQDYESTVDYESITIEGKCTVVLDLGKAQSVTLKIDGAYSVDFLNGIGEMLWGSYHVDDNGNHFGTIYSTSVIGVAGTEYGGAAVALDNGNQGYYLYCAEGQITLSIDGETVAVLEAGDDGTFDLVTGELVGVDNPDVGDTDADVVGGDIETDVAIGGPDAEVVGGGVDGVADGDTLVDGGAKSSPDGGATGGNAGRGSGGGCSIVSMTPRNDTPTALALATILAVALLVTIRAGRRSQS